MSSTTTRDYEVVLVLSDQNPENLTKVKEDIEAGFTKRGATVAAKEDWGLRKLFHDAAKQGKGHFQFYHVKADPQSVQQINADLKVNTGVIKTMITRHN